MFDNPDVSAELPELIHKSVVVLAFHSAVFVSNPNKQRYIAGSAKCPTKHLSQLLTTIPHGKLKSKIRDMFKQCFFTGTERMEIIASSMLSFGYTDTHFLQCYSNALQTYSDADVGKMLEYLIDIIFVKFGGRIFQETIPMGTNYVPLLADLVFILVWGRVYTGSHESRPKTLCPTIQFHLQIHRWRIMSE